MSTSPTPPTPSQPPAAPVHASPIIHEVKFTSFPKLLFVWPIILAGYLLWPFADAAAPGADTSGFAWLYIWVALLVLMTMGVDVGRNAAIFWIVLIALIYVLGLWLHDVHNFTFFGDIYRFFVNLHVQYNRNFGLSISILLSVPYLIMLASARLNDRWRITHNEFEHWSFGRMDDSLGRGAKTIRSEFPDVFELILGMCGTLIVFDSTGTRELSRIQHVMFLPFVRDRLNKILERTAVTQAALPDDDEPHL